MDLCPPGGGGRSGAGYRSRRAQGRIGEWAGGGAEEQLLAGTQGIGSTGQRVGVLSQPGMGYGRDFCSRVSLLKIVMSAIG